RPGFFRRRLFPLPQVLAAAFPVSVLSGQVGTLVKLVRVLMLGPVVLFFALQQGSPDSATRSGSAIASTPLSWVRQLGRYIPWFIVGFLALAAVRAAGWVSDEVVQMAHQTASILTIVAMASVGLGCDLRAIVRAGAGIVATVVGSLIMLTLLSLGLIHALGIS
ncbi:MAG: putative sulfate exporter family transporter, partial [Gemmatimonadaceae bacterium]